ncbi:hypothetical protein FRB94_011199 [Tulasnella sp. JGI-2019a]|nr:hypothetical protein FRB94_011199 [Tulasnella sp. JGI-2019a]
MDYVTNRQPEPGKYISDLLAFISTGGFAHSIVVHHPNRTAALSHIDSIPGMWNDWWNSPWIDTVGIDVVMRSFVTNDLNMLKDVPESLAGLIRAIHKLSLPRFPSDIPSYNSEACLPEDQNFGLSPKKRHEVERMCSLLKSVSDQSEETGSAMKVPRSIHHIVDIGAGQEYLTRNLAIPPLSFNVLALDADDHQTEGAVKRQAQLKWWQNKVFSGKKKGGNGKQDQKTQEVEDQPPPSSGTVTRATVFVDQVTLPQAIGEWVESGSDAEAVTSKSMPVLLTGLHACGSLTPAVLRSFVTLYRSQKEARDEPKDRTWKCAGIVIVGCCYNKIRDIDRDVPMSRCVRDHPLFSSLHLESLHLHLAAQVTHSWLEDPAAFQLGTRKIVFRALVEKLFFAKYGGEMFKSGVAVGRFNDAAYSSWGEYLRRAAARLDSKADREVLLAADHGDSDGGGEVDVEEKKLVKRLELLHVLRCMLGPVIESLIVIDRWMYLREELDQEVAVKMVNVFDQKTGSARNVALVVELVEL